MRELIIAGGVIADTFACEVIKNGGYEIVAAVDSGMDFLYRHHLTPDIIIGDMDSVNREVLSYFQPQEQIEFCALNPEKDETDVESAVYDAVKRGVNYLTILGGTGSRIDHLMGNIGLLQIGLEQDMEMELIDTNNRVRMVKNSVAIKKKNQFGNYVSLIPYTECVIGVTLEGFKYPLSDHTLRGIQTLGISNEIVEEEGKISFSEGILLVIESKD